MTGNNAIADMSHRRVPSGPSAALPETGSACTMASKQLHRLAPLSSQYMTRGASSWMGLHPSASPPSGETGAGGPYEHPASSPQHAPCDSVIYAVDHHGRHAAGTGQEACSELAAVAVGLNDWQEERRHENGDRNPTMLSSAHAGGGPVELGNSSKVRNGLTPLSLLALMSGGAYRVCWVVSGTTVCALGDDRRPLVGRSINDGTADEL